MQRRRSTWLFVAVVAALVALGLLRGCFLWPRTDYPGAHFNRSTNAVWLGVEWVKEPHSAAEVAALAENLARLEVRYVFVYASYLRPDGEFNPTYAHAAEFTRALKAAQSGLHVQAWIGLPLRQGRLPWSRFGSADLSDPPARARIAAFCADLAGRGGFDGVHLDPEPVSTDNPHLLALLEEVRAALGPDADLSIASPRIQPLWPEVRLPVAGWFCWRAGYYREVAQRVDQIAVMTYDSTLLWPQLYRQWGRFQTIALSRALAGTGVELFLGVPTSEERTWTHRPEAENMVSGLEGIVDGLNDAAARPAAVTGVAIYPYWETDAAEWATYEALWLGR